MSLIQERMRYIRKIQNSILDTLYADEEKALIKAMWLIAEENQVLLKANSPTFVYDGRWWPLPLPPDPVNCNKILHSSLYEKVQETLNNTSFKDLAMRTGIEALISNYLSAIGHLDDLQRLFPEILQVKIPAGIDPDIFNIAEPLSDTKIEELTAQNEDNMKYFKRLLMTRILLARA